MRNAAWFIAGAIAPLIIREAWRQATRWYFGSGAEIRINPP